MNLDPTEGALVEEAYLRYLERLAAFLDPKTVSFKPNQFLVDESYVYFCTHIGSGVGKSLQYPEITPTFTPCWDEPTFYAQCLGRVKRNLNATTMTLTPEENMHRMLVELAFFKGKKIQNKLKVETYWYDIVGNKLDFLWENYDYRIKPMIAPGHNPANVTLDELQPEQGWRLLTHAEVINLRLMTNDASNLGVEVLCMGGWIGGPWWAKDKRINTGCTYRTKHPVDFDWMSLLIAPGHNPDKLTHEQVGTRHGFRLLTLAEVESSSEKTGVQMWLQGSNRWSLSCCGNQSCYTYRTSQPLGFYLQKELKLAELWQNQPIIWVRGQDDKENMVLSFCTENFRTIHGWSGQNAARRHKMQYSFDRKTWHKF